MNQKGRAYISRHHMLEKGDKVIVGVSGGADSVCLLFVLLDLRDELELEIQAVHVHHGIRGVAADADEQYVRKLCQENGVDLKVFHENVKDYAKKYGLTEEEAGRNVRRKVFQDVCREEGGNKIALAHHQNDNVETFVWNLSRGTGVRGAGGIRPVYGKWIRPLLRCSRKEIESYLEKRGISYCTDETNLEDDYTRNRLRNHVIPYLEEEINVKVLEHMADAIEQFRVIDDYLQEETARYFSDCTKNQGENLILYKNVFERTPEALKSYVIYHAIAEIAGSKKDIEQVHVRMILVLLGKQVGKRCDLPYGICVTRCYEGLEFSDGLGEKEELPVQMKMRIFPKEGDRITFPENPYTKWFDYDIIKRTVKLRHREPGDYIAINEDGGRKKLKQYFVDEKIPQKDLEHIWLVADGDEIMWIVGYRQSQAYQITEHTRNILEIEINGGENNGRNS